MNMPEKENIEIRLRINGTLRDISCPSNLRLLDVLRDLEALPGTKEGCGEGECGACSVFYDGRLVNSCLIPAPLADGAEIVTIEGLRETPAGKILSRAFAQTHAAQCGFCTPGMMMAAADLLTINDDPSEEEVRTAIAGNICRCTGYDMIVDGIQLAARIIREEGTEVDS
jgi:carbon-monoxide dehydrogenase small subunit